MHSMALTMIGSSTCNGIYAGNYYRVYVGSEEVSDILILKPEFPALVFTYTGKKNSSGQSRFILFTICLPKVDTYFRKSERVAASARNHIYIIIINRPLRTAGGCPEK